MKTPMIVLTCIVAGGLSLVVASIAPRIPQARAATHHMSYKEDIVPIFKGYCVSCHHPGGEGYKASGVDLTHYRGVMEGTRFGPMVLPGEPDLSNLYVLVAGRAKIRMPYRHKPLPAGLQRRIWAWIFDGAKDN